VRVLIESSEQAAAAMARLLSSEGHDVLVLDPAELDEAQPPADVAYLDVWTPEVAPRVARLRAQGVELSCLGDLLLERWPGPTIGITGTAGKTSTTTLVASILRAAGMPVAVSEGARAGNLWPTVDLLAALPRVTPATVLLLELTSSHLAFMRHSPALAAVTSFWPDHVELHGSLRRYRAAKEAIVRNQRPGDVAVVNADDGAASFAVVAPGDVRETSLHGPVARGAYLDHARGVVLAGDEGETPLGRLDELATHPQNVLTAAAVGAAAGVSPAAIAAGIRSAIPPRWRVQRAGAIGSVPVVDDGMAATPAKATATLARFPAGSVVLVAGGLNRAGGGVVHSSAEERELLRRACDEIARAASVVAVFGEAGSRLVAPLRRRGVEVMVTADLAAAVGVAARCAAGAGAIVFSPLFPVSLEDRARFADLVRAAARDQG
jgi:UDP-N-acetylmuramoylalanine--D-glutamate ligase